MLACLGANVRMRLVIQILYTGDNGSARKFAKEMVSLGIVAGIRKERGNLRYEYYFPMEDEESVLLVDEWESQEALDAHHASPLMGQIAALREKYDLHMKVERLFPAPSGGDESFIRK